jgi:uncharacterized protein (DUF1501 family)
MVNRHNQSRRSFLRTASTLSAMVPAAGSGLALNLATMGAAAAQTATDDYKALVCVFLYGGCDNANTILATDPSSWTPYLACPQRRGRPGGARPAGIRYGAFGAVYRSQQRRGLNTGREFALHPSMGHFKSLFTAGRGAIVANVGPLVVPLSRGQYSDKVNPRPGALFSHNDQQSTWMAFSPEGARAGWGGRMGDLLAASNGDPTFTCISASPNSVFLAGLRTQQYQVGTTGSVGINGIKSPIYGSGVASGALNGMVTEARAHLMEKELNRVTHRSIGAGQRLTEAMAMTPLSALPALPATSISLARQLSTVARIIGGRSMTLAKRQVFMVGIGGFDMHDNLNPGLATQMQMLANGLDWFDRAMAQMNLQDSVTTFTASDFGRTLTSNGDGSDHGWGFASLRGRRRGTRHRRLRPFSSRRHQHQR